ncbi:MAG: hypothetical protein ABDI19_01750 [Armatimonadota bacterium]
MIDLQQIVKQLEGVFEPAQAEKVALTLYEMAQSLYERQLLAHIDALSLQLRQFEQRMLERFDALTEQTQRNTDAIAALAVQTQRNTEAIAKLEEQTQRNAEAIAKLEEQTRRNTEVIATLAEQTQRNTEAIAKLEEQTRRNAEAIAKLEEQTRRNAEAIERHEAILQRHTEILERHSELITENSRAIRALQESMERMRRHFTRRIDDLARQLGGLAMTVGYTLENEAYKALPALLLRDYGLEVIGRLKRGYAVDEKGNEYEVNILGEAQRDGQRLTIVGESKVQLSKQEVDRFIRRKLKPLKRIYEEVFPIIVTHMTTRRDVEEYARQQGIAVYFSYDF